MKLYKLLLYLTNNDSKPKDEIKFDIGFWVAATITLCISVPLLFTNEEHGWAILAIFWYIQFWDELRHNR
jgi:hypothetical protein